ncbi:MAG: DUF2480 family protein [Bacteroidetes bacterium]|nr:DUF2480 family protein [Bacteroidota bacterium]
MLVNKVAQSGLIVLDLEKYYPSGTVKELDISTLLFKGLILREKEFRIALKSFNWESFQGQTVALWCSTDAIVPQWAFMLITSYLMPYTSNVFYGSPQDVEEEGLIINLNGINIESYRDERVIIKGCGKLEKSGKAYVHISKILLPVVKTLMFGEPCSTVPVYKRK